MGANTEIAWTDHTFNPWWGCTRVSPACEKCYAESFAKRTGHAVWGVSAPRRFFADKHWAEPLKWNAAAAREGVRRRVFCASMADVFETVRDEALLAVMNDQRVRLFRLIEETPALDWQLLTKRPADVVRYVPSTWLANGFPANVWIGTTVEDQKRAEVRIPELLKIPARVRFLSCEPLLEHVNLRDIPCNVGRVDGAVSTDDYFDALSGDGLGDTQDSSYREPSAYPRVDWVIVGGESGGGARPFDIAWAFSIVKACRDAGVAVFVKQLGARPIDSGPFRIPTHEEYRAKAGPILDSFPKATPEQSERIQASVAGLVRRIKAGTHVGSLLLQDRKGGDWDEWPESLRIREFPVVT